MCNFSYSFKPVLLKLYMCFVHVLKMCNGLDMILRLFLQSEFIHFSGVITFKVNRKWVTCATPPTVLLNFYLYFGVMV